MKVEALVKRVDNSRRTFYAAMMALLLTILVAILDHTARLQHSLSLPFVVIIVLLAAPKILVTMWKVQHIKDFIPQGEQKSGKVLTLNRFNPGSVINMLSEKHKKRIFENHGAIDVIGDWSTYYEVSFDNNGYVSQGIVKQPIRIDDSLTQIQVTYQECKNGLKETKIVVLEVAGPAHLLTKVLNKPSSNTAL
jgi:hypothetical protein